MNRAWYILLSVWFWFELFLSSAVMFPWAFLIWLVTVPFDRRLYMLHQFSCLWSSLVFLLNPAWKVRITGKDRIDRKQTYVIVSNHQSGADILVLFSLRIHYKWVSKRSLFWFPFIGWNMVLNHYIPLVRGKKSSMQKMFRRCLEELHKHNSVMIFPEGTRSRDGHIQPFKTGAFHIALQAGVPVLPIAIKGTSQAIRKGGFLIRKNHNIQMVVLDPVSYESVRELEPKELSELVHARIEQELESPVQVAGR